MPEVKLIADCGATKGEWCLINNGKKKTIITQGISPYFLNTEQIIDLLQKELKPKLKNIEVGEVFYYGTGCANPTNVKSVKKAISKVFAGAKIEVTHDLMAAARALCGREKGVACILGTGSNSCYYDGKRIVKNSPGLGYVLGDEGSGAYLGRKVIQYYLYGTFDYELRGRFDLTYTTNAAEILENVYKKPLPNRYLAGFAKFLAENRGHYMIENIIEDGINDFFFNHLCKYRETWTMPVHFAGSIAFGFKDVVQQLCNSYEFELGKVLKNPMEGLVAYHS
ncbi:MAG: N-acetylglucosamine kinase [Chitinophagaceae bacterium]|nr:N-acetylglucosamine kinase [Chitinophagaceae bacterium]MBP6477194.1 N-acetylglucosamine kinase [Chitinophagaceae bacterium]MBP7109684.1 N-acetylglucosamine kinase [Chitinophagaceae bacterium]MBP7314238.1 N-acetylglucosamine kinase [Chitinophagaceae bacterium]HQV56083.1 N-acetylglucosamine kinase [Chitinophagaceae bacterium]